MVKPGVTWSVRELRWVSWEGKDYRGGVLLNDGKPLLIGTWHFLPLALEWASFQALSGSLLEKCLMQIWRMGSIVKPLILTAHTTMKLCAYSGHVGVWERARQWQPEQLQSEQTLYRMLCQVIWAEWALQRLWVKALLMTETNKCTHCFPLALKASRTCSVTEWFDVFSLNVLKVRTGKN